MSSQVTNWIFLAAAVADILGFAITLRALKRRKARKAQPPADTPTPPADASGPVR